MFVHNEARYHPIPTPALSGSGSRVRQNSVSGLWVITNRTSHPLELTKSVARV